MLIVGSNSHLTRAWRALDPTYALLCEAFLFIEPYDDGIDKMLLNWHLLVGNRHLAEGQRWLGSYHRHLGSGDGRQVQVDVLSFDFFV